MSSKKRLDVAMVERGLAESRRKAQAVIMAGQVYVNGQKVDKAGAPVAEDAAIEVRGKTLAYVSRGGLKLEKAMELWPIRLEGAVCADIGASTGGFTDCMLQRGAEKVYAVDSGYNQLDWRLRSDPRVVCMERTNARYLTGEQIPEPLDFFSVDVAFISLRLILPPMRPLVREGAQAGEHRVVVSIAAGVQLEALDQMLARGGLELPVVRIMPNTPAAIGQGVLLIAPGPRVSGEDYAGLEQALGRCGLLERVTEQQLDQGSAISGCGPAFVYLFIEALADGGVQIGLPRDKAQAWAAQMVAGAAGMVLQTGKHPGQLKDAVCSPGGTTIAGVAKLEQGAFRSLAAQAVVTAYEKNSRIGK